MDHARGRDQTVILEIYGIRCGARICIFFIPGMRDAVIPAHLVLN